MPGDRDEHVLHHVVRVGYPDQAGDIPADRRLHAAQQVFEGVVVPALGAKCPHHLVLRRHVSRFPTPSASPAAL